MQLTAAATALNVSLQGADRPFVGVSTDTRTLPARALFVALRGPHYDAHELIADVIRGGAAGAVVEHPVAASIPQIQVADTRRALGDLAQAWRMRFTLPVTAITGSNGKTTVKEMLAAILRRRGTVLVTSGNRNNEIGLPLTLFELGAEHRFLIVEMGANHAGEIARLADIARPRVAVITMCAPAHLEGFGSVEGVARAKAEILHRLGSGGTAVINAEDPFADFWRREAGAARVCGFGLDRSGDVRALDWAFDAHDRCSRFRLHTPDGAVDVALALPGLHNVRNALAAAACAWALGIDPDTIAAGLALTPVVPGRLQFKAGIGSATLIDDSYNANPGSLAAAVDVLTRCSGERWLVLGDMGELGAAAPDWHRQAGSHARAAGIEHLVTIGGLARAAGEAFGSGAEHFDTVEAVIERLGPALHPDTTVLVKASRAMRLERIIAALARPEAQAC